MFHQVNSISIHCIISDDHFFIYASDDTESIIPPFEWINHFLLWDAQSFYGNSYTEDTLDGTQGIRFSPSEWIRITANEPFNSLIEWHWDDLSTLCLSLGHALNDTIQNTNIVPDVLKFEKETLFNLPDEFYQEFHESFWEQKINNQSAWNFATAWYNSALNEMTYIQKIKRAIQLLLEKNVSKINIQKLIEKSPLINKELDQNHTIPFNLGLRLVEPNITSDSLSDEWKLDILLQDILMPELQYFWSDKEKIPSEWFPYFHIIDEQIDCWKLSFPWFHFEKFNSKLAGKFLTEAAEVLLLLETPILLPIWWESVTKARVKARAKIKSNKSFQTQMGISTFVDFDWKLTINSHEISEDEFNKIIHDKTSLYLVNGEWVSLDIAAIKRLQNLLQKAKENGIHAHDILKENLTRDIDTVDTSLELDSIEISYDLDKSLDMFFSTIHENSNNDTPQLPVPTGFIGELRPYQVSGMSWMLHLREKGFGCCLADEMGLGKTVQLIAYLLSLNEKTPNSQKCPSLIVCPTSVLGNWKKELEKFAPTLIVKIHNGVNRPRKSAFIEEYQSIDVVLTNFSLLSPDELEFLSIDWNTVALDEAQNIKNPNTKQSRTARKLKARHHIAMTGTPIENRLYELWSIFDFTNKGYLGSLFNFEKQFCYKIEKDKDPNQLALLKRIIQPFLLRRTKKDEKVALNLPDKLEQLEYVPLSIEQTRMYEEIVNRTLEKIESRNGIERAGLVLQMITRLKQICNHPALIFKDEKTNTSKHHSSKLDKLCDLVDLIREQEESVLIFTQFAEMGEIIKATLESKYGYEIPFIRGSVSRKNREMAIEDFQNKKTAILILTLKTGGTGLNLTAANHVIHFDRWWNPAVENQATDRVHRIGQSKFVHVHKLITVGTLEEKINEILDRKQLLTNDLLMNDNWISKLSNEDLRELLMLEKRENLPYM
ncbi:MAG: box helicase [Bacillales bacterium]|jgi:superfamily II DNA or RNA helicase|nr:box helicase [Bacillales bacterium]